MSKEGFALISDISDLLLDKISENNINISLSKICNFLGSKNAFIFSRDDDNNCYNISHEWNSNESFPLPDDLRCVSAYIFPGFTKLLYDRKYLAVNSIEEIPEDKKNLIKKTLPNGFLLYAVIGKERIEYIFGFSKDKKNYKWQEEDIYLIKTYCSVVVPFLRQQKTVGLFDNKKEFLKRLPVTLFSRREDKEVKYTYHTLGIDRIIEKEMEISSDRENNIEEYIFDDDRERFENSIKISGLTLKDWNLDFRILTADKKIKWIRGIAVPRKDKSGSTNWEGAFIDITEEYKKKEKLLMLSSALEQSPASIIITDERGRIEYVNKSFCELSKYNLEEIVSNNDFIFKDRGLNTNIYSKLIRRIRHGEKWNGEIRFRKKDEDVIWLDVHISPVFSHTKSVNNYVCVINDITKSKKYKEELTEAKDRAVKANKIKADFIARISHEIRTPMNGLLGMARLLQETSLDLDQQEYLNNILFSGEVLVSTLNEVLDFSKIETGNMEVENTVFDLKEQVYGVSRLFKSQAEIKNIPVNVKFDDKIPNALKGDVIKVRQVLGNLLSNAIKFTETGFINIEVYEKSKKSKIHNIRIEVSDTGIGMSEEARNKIFNDFSQADASISRKYGGTGLGLSICRKIIDLMGGEIGAESKKGLGSTFWIELPLPKATKKESFNLEKEVKDRVVDYELKPLKILLTEDNPINVKFLTTILSKKGHVVKTATNGVSSVSMAKKYKFDIILMDDEMPEKSGVEATKEIRKLNGYCKDVPIIALTGNVFSENKNIYKKVGMNDVLSKPVNPTELLNLIAVYAPESKKKFLIKRNKKDSFDTNFPVSQGEILDTKRIEKMLKGLDENEIKSLANEFINYSENILNELKELCKENKIKEIGYHAHSLKSASSGIGLNALAEYLADLEIRAKEKKNIDNFCKEALNDIYCKSIKELKKFIKDLDGNE